MNTQIISEFGTLEVGDSFTSEGETYTKVDRTFASSGDNKKFRFYTDDKVVPQQSSGTSAS
ncbi:hypothetical protein K227x_58150 [Rubripirellula lacrimiformis]|uniref:Uncharacterized protein n=1 Tax=Rubripirellula lacrimiformis TaxID=1930273 RepID=A0A517NJS9_9BACT|nr:hypothetical protein [Rubripirellula lacrimiformis]QDT07388.1 hypothetical protein K227x_58150 [Rubripirellula lacrimiformis]